MFTDDSIHWLNFKGEEDNTVLCSSIRLFRNIDKKRFMDKISEKDIDDIENIFRETIGKTKLSSYDYMKFGEEDVLNVSILREENIIPSKRDVGDASLYLNNTKSNSILINMEEHCLIQSKATGLSFNDILESILDIESTLDAYIKFSFDERFGYVTSSPKRVGCAMSVHASLAIPVLSYWNPDSIEKFVDQCEKSGLRCIIKNPLHKQPIIQICNTCMIGKTEKSIVDNINSIINGIISTENRVRDRLFKIEQYKIEDKIFRSLAILREARVLSYSELLMHIIWLRVGIYYNVLNIEIKTLNKIMLLSKPHHIILNKLKDKNIKEYNINYERAKLVRGFKL